MTFPLHLSPIISAVYTARMVGDTDGTMLDKIKRNHKCTDSDINEANKLFDKLELVLAKIQNIL